MMAYQIKMVENVAERIVNTALMKRGFCNWKCILSSFIIGQNGLLAVRICALQCEKNQKR